MALAAGPRLGPAEEQLGELELPIDLRVQDDEDEEDDRDDDEDDGGEYEIEEKDDDRPPGWSD